jgi:hypothetical protein
MSVSASQRFQFSYGALRLLMTLLGLGPGFSHIEVTTTELIVNMGWGFRTKIPRSSIRRAYEDQMRTGYGIGVHGWRGRYLVNGSMSGIVTIEIDPAARGLLMGLPVKLTTLQVSADDPSGLVAAIGRG